MNITTKIDYYIGVLGKPNKAVYGYISSLQKKRIKELELAKIDPVLKTDSRDGHIYIRLRDQEWLDLFSPSNCLRYSTIVLKYPEIYHD